MEHSHPTHKNYTELIWSIEEGQIQIPQFQRDFIWTMEDSAGLLDSVVKGYPIGTFIFWKTKERLRSVKQLGGIKLRSPKKGEEVNIVLDGQQRLTSLFAALKGLKVTRHSKKEKEDFSGICINLKADKDQRIVTTKVNNLPPKTFISLAELLRGDFTTLGGFSKEYHEKMKEYKRRVETYDFSVIEVFGFSIDLAANVFTRINVGARTLTVFEIMVARTYDEKLKFDLSEEYKKLNDKLEQIDYPIPKQTVLRLTAQILKNDSKRQAILKIGKNEFIKTWPKTVDSIEQAVAYFRGVIGIPVSQLLPYLDLLVLFAYFFYKHPKKPKQTQMKELENLFWRCSLGGRYDAAIDSRLTQDIRRVNEILKNKKPNYEWEINFSADRLIEDAEFNPNSSFIKAILCIMISQPPLSFRNNGTVRVSKPWLSRSNGKNYHCFFPKKFLKGIGVDDSHANSVVNITIVEDDLEKEKIGTKPPSEYIREYMKKFEAGNSKFAKTMRTHLIEDLKKFGVLDDDYNTFTRKRAEVIRKEIKKRIIDR